MRERSMKLEPAKSFEDLIVWHKAHAFVLKGYRFTQRFPNRELFGLTSRLRRAAASMPANIPERFRKEINADKARFYNIAQGSADECRYSLILANNPDYDFSANAAGLLDETSLRLGTYRSRVKS